MSLTSWFLVSDGGTRHRLPREMIFVGRDDCELMLQSRSVNKQHAVINYEPASDEHKVKDLGSLNGTFVNDVRIQEQQYMTLNVDDKLRFGYDTNLFTVMRGELLMPEESLKHEKFSSQLQLTMKASSTEKSSKNPTITVAEIGNEGMIKPLKPKQEDRITADTRVVPRGTPLYGQPSWWGDVDENSAKHNAKTSEHRQFKCDPGNKDVVKKQIVSATVAQNSAVHEPRYFEVPSAGLGNNEGLPTTKEGATITSTALQDSTHGHASFTIAFDTVATDNLKEHSTKNDQDHHLRRKRGAGEDLSALQAAMIAAEVKVADWLAQNELPVSLSETVGEDDGNSVKSDVPIQLRNLRGSKHEDGTQSDSDNALSEQLSSGRAIVQDRGQTGVQHLQNKPFVRLKKMPPVGSEVGQRRNYPSTCKSKAIYSQRRNERTREDSHRSQEDDQSDGGTYTIELENSNAEEEKARLMIDKVFGVEDNQALTKLHYTEHQRDKERPKAGSIDSRCVGQVLSDDLVVVGGPRWVSQWASLAASHIRTDPEGSGAESTVFANDEKGNISESRVPRSSSSFGSPCHLKPKKTPPQVLSENSEMDTGDIEEEWSQHIHTTPSSKNLAQELQEKESQLHEMYRTRHKVARVTPSTTSRIRVNKQKTTKGHEREHNICQQISHTRPGSGEKNENGHGKSRREDTEKTAKPLLRQESFTVERPNANIPLDLIPCIDPHTTSQVILDTTILLKDSEAVTVFLETTLSDLADPPSFSLDGSVSPESDIDTTSTVSQVGGEAGCKKKVRPVRGISNKNTSGTKHKSHTCTPVHSQSHAGPLLDLTNDNHNISLIKDTDATQPLCSGKTIRLRPEMTSSRSKGAKTRTAAAALSSSRPASLPQPRPTRASLLRRARLGDSTDTDLADMDRVSVASEASSASSTSRPSANRRTLSRIEVLAQPRKPRVSSPSAQSDSEATSRWTKTLISRQGSDSALRLGLQSTGVSGPRARANSASKLPDMSAGNSYVHKTPAASGRWQRVPIDYASTSEDEFLSNRHPTKNTRPRLMAPCATKLGGSDPAIPNIKQSSREQDDYMKDWTAHSEEIARISLDLAKDLAMLAQEIHDVAGEIDSVSPSSAPSATVDRKGSELRSVLDVSSKAVEMRSCHTSNQQPPAIRRRTWNKDEAVLDNLLLTSVSQLSTKIREGVDKTVSKISYNIVILGGIDGFSRKIMYLGAASNNLASTTLAFFQESVDKFGFPLRILFKDKNKWEELESKLQAKNEVPLLKTSNQEISSILQDLNRVERQLLVIDIMVDPDGTLDAASPLTTENWVSTQSPSTHSPTSTQKAGEGSTSAHLLHSEGTEQDLDLSEVKNRAL